MLEGALQCSTTALRVAVNGAHRRCAQVPAIEEQESSEFII